MSEPMPREEIVSRYLDGLLEGDELRAFEEMRTSDPLIRAALETDARVVRSLEASLAPSQGPSAHLDEDPSHAGSILISTRHRTSWLRLGGLAAALLLVACLGLVFQGHRARNSPFALPPIEPAAVYRAATEKGFEPAWVCDDDAEMLEFTRQRFRRGLLFTPTPDVEVVGWGYAAGALSETSATVLARYRDSRVVLLVDRSRHDRALEEPSVSDPSLRMFKRTVGRFVLYEITPLSRPVLLPAAYVVDADVTLNPGEPGPGPSLRSQQ